MQIGQIHNSAELIELIDRIGFLPLLDCGIRGFCAEDLVYPHDRHGQEYGWGWSLLTTPEQLYGRDEFRCTRTPQESLERITKHLHKICPAAQTNQIQKLIK